ncbi:hypothetical protein JCM1840_004408 [Sporobolomyces johnsonii]
MAVLSSSTASDAQWQPFANTDDPESLSLVALFLEDDLRFAQDAQVAQALQLELALGISHSASPTTSFDVGLEAEQESDRLVSLRLQLDLINSTLSKARIARLAGDNSAMLADSIAAQQLDQQLQATRRKEQLDHEFAVAVQRESDAGRDSDAMAMQGVEAVLGAETVQELMNPSAGKKPERPAAPSIEKKEDPRPPTPVPQCLFCFDLTRAVGNPYKESLSPSSSTAASLGMYLGDRTDEHLACLDCLATYIQTQLDDNSGRKAFPVCCPACPYELTDEDAARVLGAENLEAWHHRKLLDALPPFFCPNRSCSTRILLHEAAEEEPQADCPACHTRICTACESLWHDGYDCDQFQVGFPALPVGERDPEDIALFELARKQKWSRCPGCGAMIELVHGCHHMSCLRNKTSARCSRNPPCVLFDEQTLLAPQYRDAARLPAAITPINNPATPQTAGQVELDREHKLELLDFVLADYDPGPFSRPFTGFFLSALVCGYCHEAFETRQALQQHLVDAPHPVNTCCGRFFRARLHLQQHQRRSDGPHRSLVTGV